MIRLVSDCDRREEEEQNHPLDVIDDGRQVCAYAATVQEKVRSALPRGILSYVEVFSFGGADGSGGIVARVQGEYVPDVTRIIDDARISVLPLTRDEYVHGLMERVHHRRPRAEVHILDIGDNRQTRIAVPEDAVEEVRNCMPAVLVTAASEEMPHARNYAGMDEATVI